jgi:hypothetical protein
MTVNIFSEGQLHLLFIGTFSRILTPSLWFEIGSKRFLDLMASQELRT